MKPADQPKQDKALPFEPLIPNQETNDAMLAVRRGEVTTMTSVEDLFTSLDDDND